MDVLCKICSIPAEILSRVPGIGPVVKACCTSVGQKILMALTGLALCGFLVAHLAGNLNLFAGEEAFNGYAEKLHSLGPLLAIAETGLFGVFLVHICLAVSTTAMSRRARSSQYAEQESKQEGAIPVLPGGGASNLMLITGLVLFVYLVLHVLDMKLNIRGFESNDSKFQLVRNILSDPLTGSFYIVALVMLGVHLTHGVRSAFQSLGISHRRFNRLIEIGGVLFAWLIAVGFISLVAWAFLMMPH